MTQDEANLKKVKDHWQKVAIEVIEIEHIGAAYYAFGSELATLRLYRHYAPNKKIHQDYSENRQCFYFRLEMLVM